MVNRPYESCLLLDVISCPPPPSLCPLISSLAGLLLFLQHSKPSSLALADHTAWTYFSLTWPAPSYPPHLSSEIYSSESSSQVTLSHHVTVPYPLYFLIINTGHLTCFLTYHPAFPLERMRHEDRDIFFCLIHHVEARYVAEN